MLIGVDQQFELRSIHCVHVRAPGPGYWRGYAGDDAADLRRFYFQPGWRTVYSNVVESALVRIELSTGEVGWGESTAPIAPEVVVTITNGMLAELTVGRAMKSPMALMDFLYDAQRCRGYTGGYYQDAIAGLDIALHDALAKRAGIPLSRALSPMPRDKLPCYLSGARATDRAGRVRVLREWANGGGTAAKLFLRGALEDDLDEYQCLRDSVPEIDWWAVDALWTYDTVDVAQRAKAAFTQAGARWLECPMLPEDLDGYGTLVAFPGLPIALGEHFRQYRQLEPWFESAAMNVVQPDLGRTGFVEAMRILKAAQAYGVAITPHMGSSFDLMHAATFHFAACADVDLPCEFQASLAGRLGDAVRSDWQLSAGAFVVPETPGLGVVVDEVALQRFVVA